MTYSASWPKIAAGLILGTLFAGSALADHHEKSAAGGESMAGSITVKESMTVDVAADELWSTVRDFDALSLWHPAVESSDISEGENNTVGAHRHLTLGNGGTIDEELTAFSDEDMSYSYKILEGVLPVSNYRSTIAVESDGENKSRLIWEGHFDAAEGSSDDEVREVITGVYKAGLDNVKTMTAGN